jgi:hypothetical protein
VSQVVLQSQLKASGRWVKMPPADGIAVAALSVGHRPACKGGYVPHAGVGQRA